MLDIEAIEARANGSYAPVLYPDVMTLIAEVRRLRALKLPASQQVYNITKEVLRDAEAEVAELTAEVGRLRALLEPFAEVARLDIGTDESDADVFRPMNKPFAHAPVLTVGHLRKARAALRPGQGEEGNGG